MPRLNDIWSRGIKCRLEEKNEPTHELDGKTKKRGAYGPPLGFIPL